MRGGTIIALIGALLLCQCLLYIPTANAGESDMILTSPAFTPGGNIPENYTCEGEDISPPLNWGPVPAGAMSLALICEDPDAPVGTWIHWVYYNIPVEKKGLAEGVEPVKNPQTGGSQGINDFGKIGYGGPCPPPGSAHRYYFRLYALDGELDLAPGADKATLIKEMKGRVIQSTQIMGTFKR